MCEKAPSLYEPRRSGAISRPSLLVLDFSFNSRPLLHPMVKLRRHNNLLRVGHDPRPPGDWRLFFVNKGLGRGHVKRIKDEVREEKEKMLLQMGAR